jgi:hypothetical protein
MSSFGKGANILQATLQGAYPRAPDPEFWTASRNRSRNAGVWFEAPTGAGNKCMGKIIGITQDKDGNPLGNVIVQGFRTSDDFYVGQVISDAGGYYEFPSQYTADQHYLVIYKAGSPDVTGASTNTLVPA